MLATDVIAGSGVFLGGAETATASGAGEVTLEPPAEVIQVPAMATLVTPHKRAFDRQLAHAASIEHLSRKINKVLTV